MVTPMKETTNFPLRLVILGATGFVGTALVRQLSKLPAGTVEIRALLRDSKRWSERPSLPNLRWVPGDLSAIPQELFFKEPHGVVHFAVKQFDPKREGFQNVNVNGTASLLQAFPDSTQWIIYGSSASVYGQDSQQRLTESTPLNPQTALARSRRAAEELILNAMNSSHRSALVLRPRFILGDGDRFTFPGFLKLFRMGVRISHGTQRYSVIDVADYARIITQLAKRLAVATHPVHAALNIGYALDISFNELAAFAAAQLGTPKILRFRIPVSEPFLQKFRKSLALIEARETSAFRLGLIPRLERLATQLELVGLDHTLSVGRLEHLIGAEITGRNPWSIKI